MDESDMDQSYTSQHIEQDNDISCELKSQTESNYTNTEEEEIKAQHESPEVKKVLLETDIDSLQMSSNDKPLPVKPQNKPLLQLSDVRSPTNEISRTPVLVSHFKARILPFLLDIRALE